MNKSEIINVTTLKNIILNIPHYNICFDESSDYLYKIYFVNILIYDGDKTYLLDTIIQNTPFNSETYSKYIVEIIGKFEPIPNKISSFITDAASCMALTVKKLSKIYYEDLKFISEPFLHIYCYSHSLHLFSTYIFKSNNI